MYARSNELEEKGVINLNAVNVESNPDMEMLLGVSQQFRSLHSWVLITANRKNSPLPSSPPPIRMLLLRLARRSFNRGTANSIPPVYWPSQPSIFTHTHTLPRRFSLDPHISSLEGGHITVHFSTIFFDVLSGLLNDGFTISIRHVNTSEM